MLVAASNVPVTASREKAESAASLGWVEFLPWILDVRDRRYLDRRQFAVHLFDPADVDVLDDVAGFGIDADRSPRTIWVLPMRQELDRLLGGEIALRLLDQIENRVHAVIGIHREEIGDRPIAVSLFPGSD